MAINFPSSPAPDTIYTYNGKSWKWNGTYWAGVAYVIDLINSVNTWKKGNATNSVDTSIVSGGVTLDCSRSNVHRVVLTENVALNAPTNPITGQVINITFAQDNVGGRTITFNSIFKFPGGNDPILSSTAFAVDVLTCQYDITLDSWYCVLIKNFS
ncbi:hypothetical protein UFOVP49_87 [uncultured Caudovirales phage]|uniref:Uncharacterized protein n=1 Tax=uncultured Caudovirales phage TaxID=2100421 RepID=A0A6J5KWA0_9CAUD|nr:hypothetical protein UFOVP49_87 [uncultured Caudovirales phage]